MAVQRTAGVQRTVVEGMLMDQKNPFVGLFFIEIEIVNFVSMIFLYLDSVKEIVNFQ